MANIKIVAAVISLICILLLPILSSAAMTHGIGAGNDDGVTAPTSQSIKRVTAVVKDINGSMILLMDNSRYDLNGVNVTYKTSDNNRKGKMVAELIFLNNRLTEVVIHQSGRK